MNRTIASAWSAHSRVTQSSASFVARVLPSACPMANSSGEYTSTNRVFTSNSSQNSSSGMVPLSPQPQTGASIFPKKRSVASSFQKRLGCGKAIASSAGRPVDVRNLACKSMAKSCSRRDGAACTKPPASKMRCTRLKQLCW